MKKINLWKTPYYSWSRRSIIDFRVFTFLFMIVCSGTSANIGLTNIEAPGLKGILVQNTITGQVLDENNSPLPGASIVEKGTSNGVQSDFDGNFSINVSSSDAVLVVSYLGYSTKEVTVQGQTDISVPLEVDSASLDEVVVVGYGTQKKANLTGSVASIDAETLSERPTTNASNLLQGRMSGLEVTQPSGQPGRDNPSFRIRGLGSFGASSSPLILIDGVEGSLSNIAPNDIENVTVLKDAASASIYGSRAANGVILVTTKQAKEGAASFEYQLDTGIHSPTRLPDLVTNSVEYMEMHNSASTRAGVAPIYTQDRIDAYRNATDLEQYPNFDWLDYYFNPATVVNHYMSFSNVTDKSSYKFSLNYLDQDGILPNINYKRYNAQLNFSNQISKAVKIGTNISAIFGDNSEPAGWGSTSILAVYQHAPLYKPFLPDGSGRKTAWAYPNEGHNSTAPTAFSNGSRASKNYNVNAQVYADINLLKGLTWTTKMAMNYVDYTQKDHAFQTQEHYFYHKEPGEADYTLAANVTGGAGVTDYSSKSITPTVYSIINYDTDIGSDDNLTAMVGYEQLSNTFQYLTGNRRIFPAPSLKELNAGSPDGQSTGGSSNEWAIRSYFGRLMYNHKDKYLLEMNGRYDATSRVSKPNRWGFFPSISAGWMVSQENFIKEGLSWVDNLKLRASYGVLGNQQIGNYPYQNILSITGYPFNGAMNQGVISTRLTDPDLQWETTKAIDLGLDLNIQNGLFGLTLDWFKKNTYDILTTLPVPNSLGLSGPTTNDGELQNTGWEMELRHGMRLGEFSYEVNFIGSTFKNELLSIVTPREGVNEVGLPYNSFYVYEMEGIFQSQQDIDSSPEHGFYTPKPGDIKIKDQNDDDIIDADDRISISPYPDLTYSFGINTKWKNFSLSAFFQGVEGLKTRVYGWGFDPFVQGDAPSTRFRDAWSPTNPSNTEPGIYLGSGWYEGGYPGVQAYPSTYHLPDASYLRLKNVSLSYRLPRQIGNNIKLPDLTLTLSGDNLVTWTKFPGIDPETGSSLTRASTYPQVRIINIGAKLKL